MAHRLLRIPLRADRISGRAQLQRGAAGHCLGRVLLRWYAALWHDRPLVSAALLSLRIAAASATLALIVGTLAGFALARFGRSPARCVDGSPGCTAGAARGDHRALAAAAVRGAAAGNWLARRPRGGDRDTGTCLGLGRLCGGRGAGAAGRPGGRCWRTPRWTCTRRRGRPSPLVTLPLLAPALISGWLLAFTLSLDDVVVASFTSGPGASTLPMVVFSSMRLGPTPELYALARSLWRRWRRSCWRVASAARPCGGNDCPGQGGSDRVRALPDPGESAMHLTAERLDRIQPSLTIAIATKARHMTRRARTSSASPQGEPDFDTPRNVKDAAIRAIQAGETKYTDVAGTPALRRAVAQKFKRDSAASTTSRRRSSSPPAASR